MNKEEMEKKRDELAVLWCREDSFKSGWDACANEYDEELRIAKADIMNLTEEIEQLNKLLAKQLCKNDELGMKYTSIVILKDELNKLKPVKKFAQWIQDEKPYLSGEVLAEMAKRALSNDANWKEWDS